MKKETLSEIMVFISCVFFAAGAVLAKYTAGLFSGAFVAMFRFLTGIVIAIVYLLITYKRIPKLEDKKHLFIRAVFGVFAMVLYFVAIQYTDSGRATLLHSTYPVFGGLAGFLFFKEKIHWNTIIGLIICAVGIVVIFYESGDFSILGDALALSGGLMAGMSIHYVKLARRKNDAVVVYLCACVLGLPVTAYTLPEIATVTFIPLLFLIATGTAMFLGQVTMGYGFKYIPATKGAIITYLKVPMTLALAYFFLNETLTQQFIFGACLIIAGLILNSVNIKRKTATSE